MMNKPTTPAVDPAEAATTTTEVIPPAATPSPAAMDIQAAVSRARSRIDELQTVIARLEAIEKEQRVLLALLGRRCA